MPRHMKNQCVPSPQLIRDLVKGLQDVGARRWLGVSETIGKKANIRTAEPALKQHLAHQEHIVARSRCARDGRWKSRVVRDADQQRMHLRSGGAKCKRRYQEDYEARELH